MKKISAICAAMLVSLFANNAFAGDTVEPLDKGVVEVAPTVGFANITDENTGWATSLAVGYGVADFLTITANFDMGSDVALAGADWGFDVDLLTNLLDTDNFDIDFHTDFSYSPSGATIRTAEAGEIVITPGFEFNFDTDNEMSGFGAYLRADLPIHSWNLGKERVIGKDAEGNDVIEEKDRVKSDVDLDLTLGMYYTIMEGNQLFLEGGLTVTNMAKNLAKEVGKEGFVSLGYNVELFENIELVSEVKVIIPEETDDTCGEITVGMIFDLPLL